MSTSFPHNAVFHPSNRENMAKWITALESGAYRQVSGQLRHPLRNKHGHFTKKMGYCCLGVACEVGRLNGVDLPDSTRVVEFGTESHHVNVPVGYQDTVSNGWGETRKLDESSTLPQVIRNWLGLQSVNPEIAQIREKPQYPINEVTASSANDSLHWDFAKIAEALRYTFMIGWTDEQVAAAAHWEMGRGRTENGQKILAMLHDYAPAVAVPEQPEHLSTPEERDE